MTFDHDWLLVPCLKGCGRLVPRNLDLDHGICSRCYEMTFGSCAVTCQQPQSVAADSGPHPGWAGVSRPAHEVFS
jgi:hypothetical protein